MSTVIDKLAWIYIADGQLLATRSLGKSVYYLPGGKREPGESDQAALIREIQEELSVNLVASSIRYVGQYEAQAHGKVEGTIVRTTCFMADFVGELVPANEIEVADFLGYADLEKASAVLRIVMDDLHGKGLLA